MWEDGLSYGPEGHDHGRETKTRCRFILLFRAAVQCWVRFGWRRCLDARHPDFVASVEAFVRRVVTGFVKWTVGLNFLLVFVVEGFQQVAVLGSHFFGVAVAAERPKNGHS